MPTEMISTWTILIGLLGGLAIFLFGLDQLTETLKSIAGARMRDVLARMTTNRFRAVLAGGFTTAVIQSSSITTVLVVGFVSAGLMTVQQSVGVIMGAEIGTTVTAQIIAFKVTRYALIAVTIGFVMQFFFDDDRIRRYGTLIFGLGLIFYGMNMMGDATRPLRSYQPFIDMLAGMDNRVLTILVSAGFTALIQSSSATIGVIIVLGSQGLLSLEQGIALVFGANIGTCITALLAAIGKQRQALRPALIHVLFNVSGVLLWFGFIDELAQLARHVSPTAGQLAGQDRLAAEIPRQIANAHTIFNVGNTLIFIWFAGAMAALVTWLVPSRREEGPAIIEPRFINSSLIETPALALDATRMEIVRMSQHLLPMVQEAAPTVLRGSQLDLDRIQKHDREVDVLHAAIVRFLGKISRGELTPAEADAVHDYLSIATLYESIGDIVETNLVHVGRQRLERDVRVSNETETLIATLADKVCWAVRTVNEAVDRGDAARAREVIDAKEDINRLAEQVDSRLVHRLIAEAPHRTSTYRLESQLIENFKRIYYFSKRIAKLVADADAVEEPKQVAATA